MPSISSTEFHQTPTYKGVEPDICNAYVNGSLNGPINISGKELITVKIPDLFVSILSRPHLVNPLYETAKVDSEKWLTDIAQLDEKTRRTLSKLDFVYYCATAIPLAGYDELRLFMDWGNWTFVCDDMFDNGDLCLDRDTTKEMLDSLMASFRGEVWPREKHPIIKAHDDIWNRIISKSSGLVAKRYAAAMEKYCHAVVQQVTENASSRIATVEETLERARSTANATTTFILVEHAYGITLPEEIYQHPSFQELERIGNDFILLQNAVLSYQKEQLEGVNNNIIAVCRAWGMSAQEAFDYSGEMLGQLYREWFINQANLPILNETIDSQVQKFLNGIIDCILGNLHWSFRTTRYLGDKKDIVRQNWQLQVFGDDFYAEARKQAALQQSYHGLIDTTA